MNEKLKRVYIPMTETGFYILFSLQQERHGYNIIQHVKELTKGEIIIGAGTMYGTSQQDGKRWASCGHQRRKSQKELSHH